MDYLSLADAGDHLLTQEFSENYTHLNLTS